MAILENRVKTNNLSELFKFVLLIFKRFFYIIFIVLSIYLLSLSPQKKLTNLTLEFMGSIITVSLNIYEIIQAPINSITEHFSHIKELKTENMELKLEIRRLKNLTNEIQLVKAENAVLRDLHKVIPDEKYNYLTAKLLSISLNPFSKTAIVGAGKNQGVQIDQVVTNQEGLVGKISEISDNYSKIILMNDLNSRIPIITLSSRERGILASNGSELKIIYIQKNHSIKKGEKIITSGDGRIYPSGIEVGKVIKVSPNEILVEPIANISNTIFVNIYNNASISNN